MFSLIENENTVTVHPEGTFMISKYYATYARTSSDLREYLYLKKSYDNEQ